MEGILAMFDRFEFMVGAQVRISPQAAINNMRQSFLCTNLEFVSNYIRYSPFIVGAEVKIPP